MTFAFHSRSIQGLTSVKLTRSISLLERLSVYLVVIAWMYVVLMMSVAEATSSNGSVLGAMVTFVFYGLIPMGIVVYIMSTPARKRKIKARETAELAAANAARAAASAIDPDASGHAPGAAQAGSVAPVGKET